MIRVAAAMVDEILMEHKQEIDYGYWHRRYNLPDEYNGWEYRRSTKRWEKWVSYAKRYQHIIPVFREIIESLIAQKTYEKKWNDADFVFLFNPICVCCDSGKQAARAIKFMRKDGFYGHIIVVNDYIRHTHSPKKLPHELKGLENIQVIEEKKVVEKLKEIVDSIEDSAPYDPHETEDNNY